MTGLNQLWVADITYIRRSLAVVHRLQAITPLVQQPLMYAGLFGQSQNVVAAFQPLHRRLAERLGGSVALVSLPITVPFPAGCANCECLNFGVKSISPL